jgi:ESCRT-II complex subunit
MEASSKENSSGSDFRNFKPMFTLQPVKATREKQLKQWSSIIMNHCKDNNLNQINPSDFSLFSNRSIDRQLSDEGITAVVENMIKAGKSACRTIDIEYHHITSVPCCVDFPLHPTFVLFAILINIKPIHLNIRECRVGKWSSRQNTAHHTQSPSSLG